MGSSWFWPTWFSVLNIFTWSAFHNEIYFFSKRSTWFYRGKYIKDKIIFKHEINQHLTSFCFFQTTNFQKLRLPVLVLFKTGENAKFWNVCKVGERFSTELSSDEIAEILLFSPSSLALPPGNSVHTVLQDKIWARLRFVLMVSGCLSFYFSFFK